MASGFTVDTHLLRELGELLVGRDSTAVLELIKNAYDANATRVTVSLEGRGTDKALLRVSDNGDGMSRQRFEKAFLRIASRSKEGGSRTSGRLGRRYTGQKGIGRLATHKLAFRLEVASVALPQGSNEPGMKGVLSLIDWDVVEEQDDLTELEEGLLVEDIDSAIGTPPGTVLTLSRLKNPWTDRQLSKFVTELRSSQPPTAILHPNELGIRIPDGLTIPRLAIRETNTNVDPGFEVELAGDLDVGESLWNDAARQFQWCIEIDAETENVTYSISPTSALKIETPEATRSTFRKTVPLEGRPAFQARIFTLPNASATRGPLSGFVRSNSGVRVYLEGFRVLPYGEFGDDWLGLDRDYRSGARFYRLDVESDSAEEDEVDRREGLSALNNSGYFGAVFLKEESTGGLRSLVNREGFVPDDSFEKLVELVQTGVRLSVRVRRSLSNVLKARESVSTTDGHDVDGDAEPPQTDTNEPPSPGAHSRTRDSESDGPDSAKGRDEAQPARQPFALLSQTSFSQHELDVVARAESFLEERSAMTGLSQQQYDLLIDGFRIAKNAYARIQNRQPELRVLAGVGLQLGAFVHDINGMQEIIRNVRGIVTPLIAATAGDRESSSQLRELSRAVDELSHTLARQASYLSDVLTVDPRRRRSRIDVSLRIPTVMQLLTTSLRRSDIRIELDVEPGVKTPPMFPAEVSIVLTNLLTNAVKNAGTSGLIQLTVRRLGGLGATICVQNTGSSVDVESSEKWFLPFESTTVEVDEHLGQGLGLGLPIVRAIADDYRGRVYFREPDRGFATAIAVELPDPQEV